MWPLVGWMREEKGREIEKECELLEKGREIEKEGEL
jgi:hypothetical protein